MSESKQKDATAEQEKAREELEKAKAELEQILRQMREEEIERTLAMLEGRFRRMLESELKIYESTKRLDKIPAAQRTRDIDIQASKLGFEQGKLAVDADKALLVLREEGSSVAFPETVEMMRDDMQQVADRLSRHSNRSHHARGRRGDRSDAGGTDCRFAKGTAGLEGQEAAALRCSRNSRRIRPSVRWSTSWPNCG